MKGPENRIEELVMSASSPMMVLSTKSVIVYINDKALAIFGYPREELEGEVLDVLIQKDSAKKHRSYVRKFFKNGIPSVLRTMEGVRKDGDTVFLDVAFDLANDEDGNPLMITYLRDKNGRIELSNKVDNAINALRKVSLQF